MSLHLLNRRSVKAKINLALVPALIPMVAIATISFFSLAEDVLWTRDGTKLIGPAPGFDGGRAGRPAADAIQQFQQGPAAFADQAGRQRLELFEFCVQIGLAGGSPNPPCT